MQFTRRTLLGTTAAAGLGVAGAGCLGGSEAPEPPVAGDPDADVTVAVYEDFACGGCRRFKENVYPVLEEEYLEPGTVRYEHRDFPLPIDDTWSWAVASAAREVFETEGNDAFWAFASEIYEHQPSYSYEAIATVATEIGADGETIREAAEEDAHRSTIEDNQSYGRSSGVGGTPSVVVDGDLLDLEGDGQFETRVLRRIAEAIQAAHE